MGPSVETGDRIEEACAAFDALTIVSDTGLDHSTQSVDGQLIGTHRFMAQLLLDEGGTRDVKAMRKGQSLRRGALSRVAPHNFYTDPNVIEVKRVLPVLLPLVL
jgi:hypothetical protein